MNEKETLIPYHQRVNIALDAANSYIQRYYLKKKDTQTEDTEDVEIMRSMRRAIDALMKEIEELKGRGWISVSEQLPDCDCYVFEANRGRVLLAYREEMDAVDWNVTHWMPRPVPPVSD